MKELYKGLGHVAIYTADMEESVAFYEKIGGSVYKRDSVQILSLIHISEPTRH